MLKRIKVKGSYIVAFLIAAAGVAIFINDKWVEYQTHCHRHEGFAHMPHNRVGLVLGTAKHSRHGQINPYYANRLEAAADLYKAGKVDYLLVSGDNASHYYNEPKAMKADLKRLGVPGADIVLDYAGFRTFDSVVRAWKVFGQQQFTIISQDFHARRAMYIAHHYGLRVDIYNAKEVHNNSSWKIMLREKLARVKMMMDLYLIDTQPRYLGDPVAIR